MHPARSERALLCDEFTELGPDAPTGLDGWATRELAAHLWTRERRPDAGPGLLGRGPFAGHTARLEAKAARRPYEDLVADLRDGPPARWFGHWVPTGDLHEWFVHHEDVRRANGRPPRTDQPELETAIWDILGLWGRILTRRSEVGVVLVEPEGEERTAHRGEPVVVLRGRPTELLLRLFGRDADVVVDGGPDSVAAFEASEIGL